MLSVEEKKNEREIAPKRYLYFVEMIKCGGEWGGAVGGYGIEAISSDRSINFWSPARPCVTHHQPHHQHYTWFHRYVCMEYLVPKIFDSYMEYKYVCVRVVCILSLCVANSM